MKLNNEQIQKINHSLLREDKIYDNIVRLELVDHIASILEEKELSFEESYKDYWHSKEKVLLITYAKKQIESKKEQVENYFWKQFIKPAHLILILCLFFGLRFVVKQMDSFEAFVEWSIIILMSVMIISFVVERFISKRKYFYIKSLYNSISLFYVVSLQLSKFWIDKITENLLYAYLFLALVSLMVVSMLVFHKTYLFSKTITLLQNQ